MYAKPKIKIYRMQQDCTQMICSQKNSIKKQQNCTAKHRGHSNRYSSNICKLTHPMHEKDYRYICIPGWIKYSHNKKHRDVC